MNALLKPTICIACCYFLIINIYAQKNVLSERGYANNLASKPGNTNYPVVKFSMDETINISLDNMNAKQQFKSALLNFNSQNLMNSKIIADPINPASPLLHDDSHVLALLIHTRNSFPVLLKFALYF